jgi:uncharacterized membrane protein
MTGSDSQTPPRSGRGLRIALILSVALNLLFIGLVAGGAMSAGQRQSASWSTGPDPRALWRALPDDSREELRARFREQAGQEPRPDRDERRARAAAQDAELLALLRAETFDAEAFAALLETRRDAMAARSATAQALLVERLDSLSAAERATVAERYESRRGRRFGPH